MPESNQNKSKVLKSGIRSRISGGAYSVMQVRVINGTTTQWMFSGTVTKNAANSAELEFFYGGSYHAATSITQVAPNLLSVVYAGGTASAATKDSNSKNWRINAKPTGIVEASTVNFPQSGFAI
jgi:hypothetical protein